MFPFVMIILLLPLLSPASFSPDQVFCGRGRERERETERQRERERAIIIIKGGEAWNKKKMHPFLRVASLSEETTPPPSSPFLFFMAKIGQN